MNNKVLLMILDGWGNGRHDKADVISTVHPEYISAMTAKYPHAELRTDGENVGLPDGQMGNSEVGHLNIGAGRVVYQDLVKINRACRDNSIMQNPEVKAAFEYAKKNGVKMTKAEREREIAKLEKEMRAAARMMEYEYAAVLRDRIIELRGERK